ncbi:MAG: hypothetical protein P4M11_00970 [Candidatus Pacebacteria bacterium]|nr:hypothetical protein [Candidatus Paceibacterota bacterium]
MTDRSSIDAAATTIRVAIMAAADASVATINADDSSSSFLRTPSDSTKETPQRRAQVYDLEY